MNKHPVSHPWKGEWRLDNMFEALPRRSVHDLEYSIEQPDRAYWDWESADDLPELPVQGYRLPHPWDHMRFCGRGPFSQKGGTEEERDDENG